jgi:hypothetical protein
MLLGALLLLTLSLLGSTLLPTLTTGVLWFSLFGLAWLAGMTEFMGQSLDSPALVNLGVAVSLLVPSDALWRGASYYLQSPDFVAAARATGRALPFASVTPPAPAFVAWAVAYLFLGVVGAVTLFARRDL